MKKYVRELIIIAIQLFLFYIFPTFAGPTDVMGMIVLIIFGTFLLSFILGIISANKIKYFYSVFCALVFLPSVFIYYNSSALIHALWYLVISSIGLCLGSIVNKILKQK